MGKRKKRSEPMAVVREIDGQLVLDDPLAEAIFCAVGKVSCKATLEMNLDRVLHFKRRMTERKLTPGDAVIVLVNVNDVHGSFLADMLMPGTDWQQIRDRGEIPFARGLAVKAGIQEFLEAFDEDAASKLKEMTEAAIVVVDHGVAEVFPA
jgi:hypothetical protein